MESRARQEARPLKGTPPSEEVRLGDIRLDPRSGIRFARLASSEANPGGTRASGGGPRSAM